MRKAYKTAALAIMASIVGAAVAAAQYDNTGQQRRRDGRHTGQPVATQPSNSPFTNPINQPVPPATSLRPYSNSNRTNVPLGGTGQ